MSNVINMHEAKTTLSRLVERAIAGEDVVIARNGTPLVRLVPVAKKAEPRVPGRLKGQISICPDFELTDEEIAAFERWDAPAP